MAAIDFAMEPPTESGAVQDLAELIGADTAAGLWDLLVRAAGLQRPVRSADLRLIAEQMMDTGELVRVAGRSLKVRAITFDALSGIGS